MAQSLTTLQSTALGPVLNASGVAPTVALTTTTYPNSALAANPSGGETITITGTGFNSGVKVYVESTLCTTTYVSATSLTFISPAKSAGSYIVYVFNTDGTSGVNPAGITYSAVPVWVTASGALPSGATDNAYSQSVSATGDTIVYSLTSGSLPTGLSLNAGTGAITGTPTAEATSNFTITATDAQNQGVPRNFSITVSSVVVVDYVAVAGGGGGGFGNYGTGGGGGGGYLTANGITVTPGVTYTITIGAGGIPNSGGSNQVNGGNSVISGTGLTTVTAIGGGGGGGYYSGYQNGANGASGGGSASNVGVGGKGVYPGSTYLSQARQGYDGGTGNASGGNSSQNGGGGGGAGAAGQSPTTGQSSGGYGGVGVVNPFSGSTVGQNVGGTYYLAGGGGAGTERGASTGGAGGYGGGGQGAGSGTTYTAGTVNTGGGGGGGGYNAVENGLPGGSGVVILRVGSGVTASSTTGSPTVTTSGAYKFYTFTGSGSITF